MEIGRAIVRCAEQRFITGCVKNYFGPKKHSYSASSAALSSPGWPLEEETIRSLKYGTFGSLLHGTFVTGTISVARNMDQVRGMNYQWLSKIYSYTRRNICRIFNYYFCMLCKYML